MDMLHIHKQFFNNFNVVTEKRNAFISRSRHLDVQELVEICWDIFPYVDNIYFYPFGKVLVRDLKKLLILKNQMRIMDVTFNLEEGYYEDF